MIGFVILAAIVAVGYQQIIHIALALGSLEPKDMAQGTGLNNMMRQLGGSFGVAIMTTMIHLRSGYHRSILLEHVNQYDPAFQTRFNNLYNSFVAKGFAVVDATAMAYKAIEGAVLKQTFLLSYIDGFKLTGLFFVVCIPLLYLQKIKRGAPVGGGGH